MQRPSGEIAIAYCLRAFGRRTRKYADEIPPMPVLAGVLRAARPLAFEAHRNWAERAFNRMWPATLDTLTTDPISRGLEQSTLLLSISPARHDPTLIRFNDLQAVPRQSSAYTP